jgi:squalene cyclase
MTDDALTIGGRDAAAAATRGDDLEAHIAAGANALIDLQKPDGHWVFELEADCTIPAEYVLMTHYRGEPADAELERKIAAYLMRTQGAHGGWPLFHDGDLDMSASVKAYFALKMIGHSPDAPHMRRARDAMLARGGAVNSNVFTRSLLALYGFVPWRAVPVMPVEIMLLPRWCLWRSSPAPRTRAACGSTNYLSIRPANSVRPPRRRTRNGAGSSCSAPSTRCCARPSRCSPRDCAAAPSPRPWPS